MTQPRRLPMERTVFAVCRRVQDRRFMLRPDAALTNLVTWLLVKCAVAFGIEVHAMTVMSSHYHLVCSASEQRVSVLMERLNGLLGLSVNALRRARRGILWEPGQLSIIELKTVEAVVFEVAYAIVNPVAAGLVWHPRDWPGLCVQADELGQRVLEAVRPAHFFLPGTGPERAALAVTLPACLLALGEDEARRRISAEVERQLAKARAQIKKNGWRVLGPVAARNVSPFRRAKTWETFGTLHPHFATGPGRVSERREAAAELVAFREDYRAALDRYLAGERGVVFPYGTYLMRVRHRVEVEPAPS